LPPWREERRCLPPERGADFAWRMGEVLDVDTRPPDPRRPPIRPDEASARPPADVAPPLPAAPGRPTREDDGYERHGTVGLCRGDAPPLGRRHVTAGERRTGIASARVVEDLLAARYPEAERLVPVLDTPNAHTPAPRYAASPAAEAGCLADGLVSRHTPKHGPRLHMAASESRVLARRCLGQRLPDRRALQREVVAWEAARNAAGQALDRRFTTADARITLKRLYPTDGS